MSTAVRSILNSHECSKQSQKRYLDALRAAKYTRTNYGTIRSYSRAFLNDGQ
jgi:hypothetical protein